MRWLVEKVVHDPREAAGAQAEAARRSVRDAPRRLRRRCRGAAALRRSRVRRLERLPLSRNPAPGQIRLQASAAPASRSRPDHGGTTARLLPALGGAARRSSARRRQLRRHGRWAGDDRWRLGADRLRRGHRDAGRAAGPFRRCDDRGGNDAPERYGRLISNQEQRERRERDRPPPRPADGHCQWPARPALGRTAVQCRGRAGAGLHRLRG